MPTLLKTGGDWSGVRAFAKQVPFLHGIKQRILHRSLQKSIRAKASFYADMIRSIQSYCGSLDGKRILEAGVNPTPDLIAEMDFAFDLKEAVGVNLICQTVQFSPTLRVEHGDLRRLTFE